MRCVPFLSLNFPLVWAIANSPNSSSNRQGKCEMRELLRTGSRVDPKGMTCISTSLYFRDHADSHVSSNLSVGYVEFRELESVQKALALTGTKLLGLPVMVQYTEAEKNRQAMANTQPNNVSAGYVAVAPPTPVQRTYVAPKPR